MATLLVVHHTTSPALEAMFSSVVEGATTDEVEGVTVRRVPALTATVTDALEADGYVLGTPANIGYVSGALKHFFDQVYYPCLDAGQGRPFACYVHGSSDATGALRAIETITTGMGWRQVAQPVVTLGAPERADLEACWELGATLAAVVAGEL